MGNDQSSTMHPNNGTKRRESTALRDHYCSSASLRQMSDDDYDDGTRLRQPQHDHLSQWHPTCGSRRRRSSCAALQMGPAGTTDDGIQQQHRQMAQQPRDLSLSRLQSGTSTTARALCQSPHRVPSQWAQQQEAEDEAEEGEEKPLIHFPLNPVRSVEAPPPPSSRVLPLQQALISGGGGRHFLAPSSPTVAPRNSRNRRMSVAGDQQESLRRELARAGAAGGIGISLSTGGTPQRRFSRTSNCGANSATISLVTRKMSEMAAGAAVETTVHEQLKLSSYQLHILQQSWPRIRSSGVFANAFRDLAHRNASAKEMFQKMSIVEGFSSGKCCDQKEHGRQLGELFDFALQNLNGPSRLVQDRCYRMGEQHFTVFGSSNEAQLWDDLGESISHALAKTESVRGKREAFRAWITLTNFLVESMRVGYTQQFKRRSLQRHSSSSQVVVQLATLEEYTPSAATMMATRHRSHTPTVPLTTL